MKKVLIIEDNEDNMELVVQLLTSAGYEYICANSGEKGIEMALSENPDFILLDIQLPDIDGFEVLRRIRLIDAVSHILIIAVTSFAMTGDKERLLRAGCDGYIEKPIDPMLFLTNMEKIIKGEK